MEENSCHLHGKVMIPLMRLLGAGLVFLSTASASEYFVFTSGKDSNPGTKDLPFQTLAKAVTVVGPGDTCWLREGTYREMLKPQRSGEEGKPVEFKAWPGEKVVLSGLDPVTGWQQEPNSSIWEAPMAWDLKASNQVFCNGQMLFEARWPHKKTTDPMVPEGAPVQAGSGADKKSFVCPTLPDLPPDVWKGATVWMLANAQWSSWTSALVDYHPAEKRLFYDTAFAKDKWWIFDRHLAGGTSNRNTSIFYISGSRELLQAPGEWYVDAAAGKLLLIPPAGHETDFTGMIEAKRRSIAVDLRQCSYVTVSGVEILGATLKLSDAHHCLVEGIKASYICHSRGGATINQLPEDEGGGISISGEDNILRDSEIAWSAGDGVNLRGKHNSVINCYIHDCDYFGSYNKPVAVEGEENMLSHCTIARAGRDCVQPTGLNNRIEYNDISQAGLICQDLAMVYSAGRDGGNTEIAYNWVHDAPKRMSSGIYLDNYSRDYIVHHNMVWGVPSDPMAMNRPSDYNLILNNTFYGSLGSNWGPWKNDITMPGCRIINNIAVHTITVKPEAQKESNLENFSLGSMQPEKVPEPKIPDAPGVALAGITPSDGDPSIGAYQAGQPRWTAGWDPQAHPDAAFDPVQTPLRNLLPNSSFDYNNGDLLPWQNSPGSQAKTEHFDGFNNPPAEKRNAIQNHSLHFSPGTGEVFQELKDLPAGKPLILAGYVRGFDGAAVSLHFDDADGKTFAATFPAKGDWVYMTISIPAEADRTTGRVVLTKSGGGDAYVDNLGLSIDGL